MKEEVEMMKITKIEELAKVTGIMVIVVWACLSSIQIWKDIRQAWIRLQVSV